MADWRDVTLSPDVTLGDAIAQIDASGLQVALFVDVEGKLVGILTDGNIRRAVLRGVRLDAPVAELMFPDPTTALPSASREELLALMREKAVRHIPLVDETGRLVGLSVIDDLIGATEHTNWVVLMAGGRGMRLRPLTDDCPKPLLDMGGKPILETIVERFADQGFKNMFVSVNYRAEMIQDHFGAGERWGVKLDYLHEKTKLGTAGALSLLPGKPTEPIIVMNGDLLTRTNFDRLLEFHNENKAAATMAVCEYDFQVPYGTVQVEGNRIRSLEEKPVQRFFINAGIYAISPEALEHLPAATSFDMPTLFEYLIKNGQTVVAYPLREYWVDVGQIEELERAQKEWSHESAS